MIRIFLFIVTLCIISMEMLITIGGDLFFYHQISWLTLLHIIGLLLLVISVKKIQQKHLGQVMDLKAQINATEQEFADKNKVLSALLDNIPCAIATINAKYQIQSVNDELTHLTGFGRDESVGKQCFDVFGSGKICPNCPVKQSFASGKVEQNVKAEVNRKKEEIYIEQIAIPILNEEGGIEYVLEVVLDATEKMRLRRQHDNLLMQTITALVNLIESRDQYTGLHSNRVRDIAVEIGKELGLPPKKLEEIAIAAVLHDIGKIGSPESILNKPGRLTNEEYEIIKQHPSIGYNALYKVDSLKPVAQIVLDHHERMDGKGYPSGKYGEEISLTSKILSVADVYEAITADRIYRKAMSKEGAIHIIKDGCGTQFDPDVVKAFLQVLCKEDLYFKKVLGRERL